MPLYALDSDRVRSKAPTYTVFNGRYNRFVEQPLRAKAARGWDGGIASATAAAIPH